MLRDAAAPDAESLAIEALTFLAEDAARLERFLALTGIAPDGIRAAAREAGFLGAVLDHLMGDEALLLAFSANHRIAPEAVARARSRLGC